MTIDKLISIQITKAIIIELEASIDRLKKYNIEIKSNINSLKDEIETIYQKELEDIYKF